MPCAWRVSMPAARLCGTPNAIGAREPPFLCDCGLSGAIPCRRGARPTLSAWQRAARSGSKQRPGEQAREQPSAGATPARLLPPVGPAHLYGRHGRRQPRHLLVQPVQHARRPRARGGAPGERRAQARRPRAGPRRQPRGARRGAGKRALRQRHPGAGAALLRGGGRRRRRHQTLNRRQQPAGSLPRGSEAPAALPRRPGAAAPGRGPSTTNSPVPHPRPSLRLGNGSTSGPPRSRPAL